MSSSTTPAAKPAPTDGIRVKSIGLVFAVLLFDEILASLDQTIVSTALPTVVGELNGIDHMLWVVTIYVLASTIVMPVVGKLGDLRGRRGLFLISQILFMFGSIICGAAGDIFTLIVGRGIQGIGGGGLLVLSQAIVADIIPARKRALYLNLMGIGWALPMLVGPLLGGLFTDVIGWRWAFWINVPFTALSVVLCAIFLPIYPQHKSLKTFDVWGMLSIALSVICLTLASSWGGVLYSWTSPVIIGLFVATIGFAALFVLAEHKAKEPLMPLFLFKNRNFVLTTLGGFIILFAMMAAMSYLPTYFQLAHGMNATAAGYMEVPMSLAYFVSSIISGWLIAKRGKYKGLMVLSFVIATIGAVLLCTLTADMSVFFAGLYLTIMGFGMGLSFEVLVLIVQNEFPAEIVGTATGATNFFREIGTTLGSSVAGAIFTGKLTSLLSERLAEQGSLDSLGINVNSLTPSFVHSLPAEVQQVIAGSYNDAIVPMFMLMVPLTVVAGIMMIALKERPLATSNGEQGK